MFGIGTVLDKITSLFWGFGFLYHLGGGVSLPTTASLNGYLRDYGYPSVPEAYLSEVSGWRIFLKGYTVSRFSGGIWGGEATSGDKVVSIDGSYSYYSLGKLLTLKSGTFYLLPSVGLGRSNLTLTVGDNVVRFDSLLSSPGKVSTLRTDSWILTPEAEFLWRKEAFLFLGARLGYMLAFPKGRWTTEGVEVKGGPNTAMDGLYFHLTIGLGFVVL